MKASSPQVRTQTEEMQDYAEQLFAARLAQLNAEGKTKNQEYKSLVVQANSACNGTTEGMTASEGSVFVGYNPLIAVNADGSTRVYPNPIFLPTTSSGSVSIDNKTTPLCRSLQAQMEQRAGWARQVRRELDDMEATAQYNNIYPGVVRSLSAVKLKSW
jgi:hypothetical protein